MPACGIYIVAYINVNCNYITLSGDFCENYFKMSPQELCEKTDGSVYVGKADAGFELFYNDAEVEDSSLVLTMSDDQIEYWKGYIPAVDVLELAGGNTGLYVTEETKAEITMMLGRFYDYEYEISDDYTQIKTNYQDKSIGAVICTGALFMQILEGVPSNEATVKYTIVDESGSIISEKTYTRKTLYGEN